jgi:hypothetical protein|tara:strand:+ start:84 stop:410 length:327 start_codon:yes stop_codon:yes gene_type:complete
MSTSASIGWLTKDSAMKLTSELVEAIADDRIGDTQVAMVGPDAVEWLVRSTNRLGYELRLLTSAEDTGLHMASVLSEVIEAHHQICDLVEQMGKTPTRCHLVIPMGDE